MLTVYGVALVALGCWAAFTTSKTLRSYRERARHGTLALLGIAFVASCLLPGLAMLAGRFAAWMLIPLGVCYVALVPFPCYFEWANHGRIRTGRTILFLMVGAGLVALGTGLLPPSWFGL